MQLGRTLQKLREKKGITQVELARTVGVTQTYIAKLESGAKINPSLSVMTNLARSLNVEVADLLHSKSRRRRS
jgi:XRE family transcriptional regulator of biofilm formation